MNISLAALLKSVKGQTAAEVLLQEYASSGYVAAFLKIVTKKSYAIQGTEIADAPFETFTLACSCFDGEIGSEKGASFPWRSIPLNMLVSDLMIVEREEWIADQSTAENSALDSSQTLIDVGPLGSAPPLAVKINVTCGIVLRGAPRGDAILFYLNDVPGILGVSTDQHEIDDFIRRYTETRL